MRPRAPAVSPRELRLFGRSASSSPAMNRPQRRSSIFLRRRGNVDPSLRTRHGGGARHHDSSELQARVAEGGARVAMPSSKRRSSTNDRRAPADGCRALRDRLGDGGLLPRPRLDGAARSRHRGRSCSSPALVLGLLGRVLGPSAGRAGRHRQDRTRLLTACPPALRDGTAGRADEPVQAVSGRPAASRAGTLSAERRTNVSAARRRRPKSNRSAQRGAARVPAHPRRGGRT